MVPLYSSHIPISNFQRFLLGISSAAVALKDPYRDDMVAVCGETTACRALEVMRKKMEMNNTGNRILKEKPRLSTSTIDLKILKALPPKTFGRQYVDMLSQFNITPDSRKPVKFVDDPELAYILQRYREVHDFNHLLLNQPTNLYGEVVVKWFEAIQTNLPMCWLAAVGGSIRLNSKRQRDLFNKGLFLALSAAQKSTFFMNVYFEDWFTEDIDELRSEMKLQ